MGAMDTQIIDREAGVIGRHGAIKLHGPDAFAGMRAAGRLSGKLQSALQLAGKELSVTASFGRACLIFLRNALSFAAYVSALGYARVSLRAFRKNPSGSSAFFSKINISRSTFKPAK